MARVLVQGASRGIGLQFCRHILKAKPESVVIATCRNPDTASELLGLQSQYDRRLRIMSLDVTKEHDVKTVSELVGSQPGGLDLLINSAGMLHPSGKGETSLKDVTPEGLLATFQLNTIGPLMMARYFYPLLAIGGAAFGKQATEKKRKHNGVLVNMSAKVGSTTLNGLGGWYSYRLSKAALNMATKNLSIELGRGQKKIICLSLHPGTVDTDLSRPYHKGVPKEQLFSSEHSVNCLMNIIENATLEDSGKFFNWSGEAIQY